MRIRFRPSEPIAFPRMTEAYTRAIAMRNARAACLCGKPGSVHRVGERGGELHAWSHCKACERRWEADNLETIEAADRATRPTLRRVA